MKIWQLLVTILGYIVYVVVGGLIFRVLEREEEKQTDLASNHLLREWLANNTCVSYLEIQALLREVVSVQRRGLLPSNITGDEEETWNVYSSIYFAITVVTTIGYGNISPVTSGGRVFCIFFALIGIPFALIMFAEIGAKLAALFTSIDNWCLKQCCQMCNKYPKVSKFFRFLFIHAVFAVLLLIIPAIIFSVVEEDWSIGTAIYYSFITLTTIGFGDYVAGFDVNEWQKPVYRLMVATWIVIGLAWMSSVIALTQGHLGDAFAALTKKKKSENLQKVGPVSDNGESTGVVDVELQEKKHKAGVV